MRYTNGGSSGYFHPVLFLPSRPVYQGRLPILSWREFDVCPTHGDRAACPDPELLTSLRRPFQRPFRDGAPGFTALGSRGRTRVYAPYP